MSDTSDDNVKQLPVNVDFDLDAYQRPEADIIPPFVVRLGGKVIEMQNPDDMDWKDLLDITDPVNFLRYSVTADERAHIFSLEIPGHKLNELMERYQAHFKIQEKVQRARQAARFDQR